MAPPARARAGTRAVAALNAESIWRLLSNAPPRTRDSRYPRLEGDPTLAAPLLSARAVMV